MQEIDNLNIEHRANCDVANFEGTYVLIQRLVLK
jgi:hypothetical protein